MKTSFLNIKISVLLFVLFTSTYTHLQAQQTDETFWNNVRFGGGIGLGFGDGFFSGTLAPSAIYEFNKHVSLGLGLNGTYNSQKNLYKSTILGASVIGLVNATNDIQISAEYEQLNVNRRYNVNLNIADDNYWSPALFVGAGFRNGNVTFGVRYDVLYDENRSVYGNAWTPFVRFYF